MSSVAMYLRNVSEEDFTGYWDSVAYTIKAGKEVLLQDYIAVSLAKDLAMREMNKRNNQTPINPSQDEKGYFTNQVFREEVQKYLSTEEVKAETPEKLEIKIIEKKKAGRPKKVKEEVKEEEFPDLK